MMACSGEEIAVGRTGDFQVPRERMYADVAPQSYSHAIKSFKPWLPESFSLRNECQEKQERPSEELEALVQTVVDKSMEHLYLRIDEKIRHLEQWFELRCGQTGKPTCEEEGCQSKGTFKFMEGEKQSMCAHIEGSIWEALVASATDKVGSAASVVIFLGVIISTLLQGLFCLIVQGETFTADPFPDLRDLLRWRLAEGHSHAYVDPIMGTSMVARVCNSDDSLIMSNDQRDIWENIQSYQDPIVLIGDVFGRSGEVLCFLAMFLFTIVVAIEIKRSFWFFFCFSVSRGRRTSFVWEPDGKLWIVSTLGPCHLAMLILITLWRIAIALALLLSGNMWLAHTKDVNELVLNAVATCFVLDVDEMVYQAFLPASTQITLSQVASKPLSLATGLKSVVSPLVSLSAVSGTVFYFYSSIVVDGLTKMDDIQAVMCGDNVNFVHGIHDELAFLIMRSTVDFNDPEPVALRMQDFLVDSVKQMTLAPTPYDGSVKFVNWQLSRQAFESQMELDVGNAARLSECRDDYEGDNIVSGADKAVNILFTQSDGMPGITCGSLKHNCQDAGAALLRMVCPVTCGCNSPRSGLAMRDSSKPYGCPIRCRQLSTYLDPRQACTDPIAEELVKTPAWNWFFPAAASMIGDYFHYHFSQYRQSHKCGQQGTANVHEFFDCVRQQGCQAIGEMQDRFCVDTYFANLRSFCPIACNCTSAMADCPPSCR